MQNKKEEKKSREGLKNYVNTLLKRQKAMLKDKFEKKTKFIHIFRTEYIKKHRKQHANIM